MAAPPIAERHKPHFHRKAPVLESVRVATTADIVIATALNAADVLDGITLAADDRVLVKNQTAGAENGVYVVSASPARDYDVSTVDPAFGYLVYVREGTANGATLWKNTNTTAPTIGTTALTFAEGPGSPTTADYLVGTAQAGLSAEIVVGTTPGGELGGTWASPTVDATHAGSAHLALSTATPLIESGAGSAGAAVTASKGDHVHPALAGSGDTVGQFIVGWDGGGSAITAGAKADIVAPFSGTITGWTLLADASGSAVVDVWKDTYANYPPTVADTITAAAKPTITAATKATGSPTGWTTAVTAGQTLRFNLDSASAITRLVLVIDYSRP